MESERQALDHLQFTRYEEKPEVSAAKELIADARDVAGSKLYSAFNTEIAINDIRGAKAKAILEAMANRVRNLTI